MIARMGSVTQHLSLLFLLSCAALACVEGKCPKGTVASDDGLCNRVPKGTAENAETREESGGDHSDSSILAGDRRSSQDAVDGGKSADERQPMAGSSSSEEMPDEAAEPCANSREEVCDDIDNDCDGKVDENLSKVCEGADAGVCQTSSTCAAGAWSSCTLSVEPHEEVCDGKADDDCDGIPDAQDSDCECTNGDMQDCSAEHSQCERGARLCADGKWARCVCEQASVFHPAPEGCATSLGVGSNGNAWTLGCGGAEALGNNSVYQLQGDAWSKVTGAGIQLAVSPEGNPWVVNNKGEVYKWNRTAFELTPETCATWVGVAANDDAWIIGCGGTEANGNHSVYRLIDGAWIKQSGAGVQIAVAPEGNAWVMNNNGDVYRWNGSDFEATPQQCATSLGVGRSGTAWIVGCEPNGPNGNRIYQLTDDHWTLLESRTAAKQIAVSPEGIPWIINANGQVLRYSPS